MDNKNKDLTPEQVLRILKDGSEVVSGGLRYKLVEDKLYRIDSSGNSTPIGADIETFTRMHHCYSPREYYLSIFNLKKDKEYYAEDCQTVYRRKEDQIEYQSNNGEWKRASFHAGVPKFCPVTEEEWAAEPWLDINCLNDVLKVIKKVVPYTRQGNNWTWIKNSRCKYIELRIDMRDGGFVLLDRSGQRISIKELEKQH